MSNILVRNTGLKAVVKEIMRRFGLHTGNTSNPHSVTAAQVGLGSVANTGDSATPVSGGTTKFTTGGAYTELAKKVDKIEGSSLVPDTKVSGYDSHLTNTSNPHSVTKAQIGLGNVANTGDSDTPVSGGTTKFTTGGAYTEFRKKPNYEKISSADGNYLQPSAVKFTEQALSDAQKETARKNIGIDEYFSKAYIYGVSYSYNNASPTLTRIGNMDLHKTLPIQSLMRRCVLDDNGDVIYYLDSENSLLKEDGTYSVLDGSVGQVMVEIPEHYRKMSVDTDASTYTCEISMLPFDGAMKINKCYISAFEASLDRTNLKLSSVINTSSQYRGGNNTSSWDGTYRSLLGMPVTSVSLTNFRVYAKNRGDLWNCQELDIYTSVFWLFAVEYATFNSQLDFNANLTENGYHQGGLGSGVTGISDWSTYNSYNPVVPCGVTASIGNKTGVVKYDVIGSTGDTYYTAPVSSYRGIENPFGHIWKWTDGFLAIGDGTAQTYYVNSVRGKYESVINDYYKDCGKSAGANGFVKGMHLDSAGYLLCNSVGGGSNTYLCDYHYEATNNGTVYALFVGGDASYGSAAGFGCFYSYAAPSNSPAAIGSRLCHAKTARIIE